MHISPNDSKTYRQFTLANALRVLIIHDEKVPRSAAALSVNVGHFHDPENREGMAHFLEHMLFLGTEKYPREGQFQSFISQNGGSNNARPVLSTQRISLMFAPLILKKALTASPSFLSPRC